MGEQNSLQIILAPAAPKGSGNPRGRPSNNQSINYGPKPRSIVSQILENMVVNNRITFPIEWNNNTTDLTVVEEQADDNIDGSTLFEESDRSEESNSPKPKNRCKSKTKKIAPKSYSCDILDCMYNTKSLSNLGKHKRTHTGEKPYLCDRCSFRTSFSNSLTVHKRLHTRERPYQCKHCDYRCNSISNLKKHCHNKHKEITNCSVSSQLQVLNGTNIDKT